MSHTKRNMLVLFGITGSFVVALIMGLAYFFIANKAPVLQGKVRYHVSYKEDKTLDIYLPTKMVYKTAPVIVYFHGGAWIVGRKEAINFNRFNEAINDLRQSGYCVISPAYTLAKDGQSPFPECIVDAYEVLNWIERHADEYSLDLSNVGVFGESAGAHLAMMVAMAPSEEFGAKPNTIHLKYLVDIYGPADMDMLYHGPTLDSIGKYLKVLPTSMQERLDLSKKLFGFNPSEDTIRANEFMSRYSPITYLNNAMPPTLLIHGNADRVVPIQQSINFKNKLDAHDIPNEFYTLDRVDHGFIKANKNQRKKVQKWLSNFVKKQYAN